jgi:hypothetical protein
MFDRVLGSFAAINAAREVPANSSLAVRSVIKINDVTAGAFDLGVSISNFSNTLAVLHAHEGLAEANGPVVTNFVERPMRVPVPIERPFPRDFLS